MNTPPKDVEAQIDIAIANLVFSGLSIEQMKKIPKWLLDNIDANKPSFKSTVTTYTDRRVREERARWSNYIEMKRNALQCYPYDSPSVGGADTCEEILQALSDQPKDL